MAILETDLDFIREKNRDRYIGLVSQETNKIATICRIDYYCRRTNLENIKVKGELP